MHKLIAGVGIVAMLAASAVPTFASTGGGGGGNAFSNGATIKITGAHLLAKVAVVVDVAVTCQPINGNDQLTLGYGPGQSDLSVTITQRVGKTVASGSGSYTGQNTTITCDGTSVTDFTINVVPFSGVPFTRGTSAMDASTFIQDLSVCCSGPVDQADTGLIAMRIGR